MKKAFLLSLTVPALMLMSGCSSTKHQHDEMGLSPAGSQPGAWSSVTQLVAVLHSTAGNKAHGVVKFYQAGPLVKVVADIEGLNPNQLHAFHIHEFGDCSSPDGSSAGGHYNPEGHQHGLTSASQRHAGDLGNVQADAEGKAHYEISVDNISLVGMKNPIIGRGVIVHAKTDDGGQPVGNAGPRIACGVIGVAKPGN